MTRKRRFIKHLPLVLASLALGLGVFVNINLAKNTESVNAATNLVTYYSNVNGSGSALLSSIANVIGYDSTSANNKITDIGYDGLKAAYTKTDVRSDGKIRDIYSDNTSYTPGSNFASSYNSVGDGYNREHVIPKSWWGHSGSSNPTKQGSDLFIVLPSDAKANGMRSNYPYGLTNSTTMYKMADDPVGNKLGTSSNTSYVSGTVFEPFEDRKGDIARIYFYAAAAYKKGGANNGAVTTWTDGDGSKVFSSSGNNGFVQNYLNLLLKWHTDDPVSQFEIDRNENVQTKTSQGNRNPFVDHPSWVDLIWGGTYSGTNSEDTSSGTVVNGQLSPSSNPYLTSISVQTAPNKTTYTAGEYFDPTGLVINRIYSDTSLNDTFTYANHTSEFSFTPSTSTALTTSNKSVSITYGGKTTSQTITVTSSGGSGGSSQDVINNSETSSYLGETATNSWATDFSISGSSGASYTIHSMGTSGTSNGLQWNSNGFLYSTVSGGTITGVSAVMTSGKSVEVYGSNSAFSSNSGGTSIGTISGTNSLSTNAGYTFIRIKGSSSGNAITSITIEYGSASQKTLSSITVSTAPTKTSYNVGQYFDPTGLVIRRSYSDSSSDTYSYAGHTSEFTFIPSTSTALTVSHTSVTIGYGGKSCSQAITVNVPAPTSITAYVSKTYHVGETILASDITVKDNNNNTVTGFSFSNDGYQFLYTDAASGGSATSKTFTNAISYSNLTCSLTVSVSRTAYVAPSTTTDTITASDLTATGTSYSNFSNVSKSSGAKYAGNSAKNSAGAIQLRTSNSNSGIVSTTSGGTISKVTIKVSSGSNTIDVYGKNTAYSDATDLYNNSKQGTLVGSTKSTDTITFSTSYTYVGIRSNSGAVYLTSVDITYGSSETAKNIANYVMYADTNGQCTTKLSTAVSYISKLSSDEKTTLQTSSDYVISTARTRLEAWARSQGKTINYSNGTLSNANNSSVNFIFKENNNTIIMVAILATVGMSAIGVCLFIRRKRAE